MSARFADAVIVAAGVSVRMGGIDKLDELLVDKPLLAWSVAAMAGARSVDRIVIVARADRVGLLTEWPWLARIADGRLDVVAGGEQRSDSVRNGVAATQADVVLVHDGARPLASSELADAVAAAAAEHGAAVPVLPVVDSLKIAAAGRIERSVDRESLVRSQTPQGAKRSLLLDAFAASGGASYTDEAALLESRGVPVFTVPGEAANIKVTDRGDLDLVTAIAEGRQARGSRVRFAYGYDSHGFGPEDGLRLGGVEFKDAPRLYGHSDGDVVLHALANAALSAAGIRDLGRLFPADDPKTTGLDSSKLLAEALAHASHAGWLVDRAQVSILGARPRLGGAGLDAIRDQIATLVGLDSEGVSVVASTGNLSGPEGAGRVISATALITVVRR